MFKKFLIIMALILPLSFSVFAKDPKNDADTKININTATAEMLEQLKHVGPSMAKKIVEYRTKNGKFKSVDDLTNIKGISKKIINDTVNSKRLTTEEEATK